MVDICFQEYKELFDDAGTNPGDKTLEDKFFEHEVRHFKTKKKWGI
jgi:V-type H+-transporting ATPase subunit d